MQAYEPERTVSHSNYGTSYEGTIVRSRRKISSAFSMNKARLTFFAIPMPSLLIFLDLTFNPMIIAGYELFNMILQWAHNDAFITSMVLQMKHLELRAAH